ncbi:MAG: DUF3016 domain-containing protein [Rhodanobacteraceae bacterium]|jgi:hypothetical protein|nr:DUF3016 domain-containing protein [Rhodanobacteraceae bacterium]
MKPIRLLSRPLPLLLTAALGIATPLMAAATDAAAPHVVVTWTNPAKFTDVRYDTSLSRQDPEQWLGELARYLQQRAEQRLPPGEHLDVTFTDIQRAGMYEPWRGPQWNDIRIVKDVYSPRIDLRFTLTGADGKVLEEGTRTLRDLAFLHRDLPLGGDPLRFEKRLLDDWLRREFAPAPRG